MDAYFLDSSALLKRYRRHEQGHAFIASLCDTRRTGTLLYIAELARAEVATSLYRNGHRDALNDQMVNVQVALFQRHIVRSGSQRRLWDRPYHLVPWGEPVLSLAQALARKYRHGVPRPIRTLDAIQLSSCLLAQRDALQSATTLTLLCSDRHLLDLAVAEGLGVVHPELVP